MLNLSVIETFALSDLVDISIVSFIAYRFLFIIKGTRARQMLFGVFGLATLYWLSVTFKLISVYWILNFFLDYIIIILIILFQDEVRSALISLGSRGFLFKKKNEDYSDTAEEVIKVVSTLTRQKMGALIVFERSQGLQNYILTGTKLDAFVHSDFLITLFQHNSPLHDGAVILNQERVLAAGCFLPLSKNAQVDKNYGTRHRAALGISEETDALVVIVSEEKGTMSICCEGEFFPMDNESQLRNFLLSKLDENIHPKSIESAA